MTPAQAAKLRILDPACGSGSFLIGAYRYLLDWHLDWYVKDGAEKHAKGRGPKLYRGPAGDWRLTTAEKKRILLNNIYGVDIDAQAVEVTKLSLLLKVLEGESGETLANQLRIFQERALPDLDGNIKCGNSLIGPDFYNGQQMSLLDEEERYRINVFDWKDEKRGFGKIMKSGGFDAVIGNPPYVRIQTLNETQPEAVRYFGAHYCAAGKGNYDIYVLFLEKAISLLNRSGISGYICPHKFFNAKYGEPLRAHLAAGRHLSHIVHFGHQQVFEGATTYTCLLFLNKGGSRRCNVVKVDNLVAWREGTHPRQGFVSASQFTEPEWNLDVGNGSSICRRLDAAPSKLMDIAHLFVGLQTDADEVFVLEVVREAGNRILCYSKATGKEHWFERNHLKHFLKGALNIRRYCLTDITKRLLFPYVRVGNKSLLIEAAEYQRRFPLAWQYLEHNRKRLAARNKGQMGVAWYGYVYKKNHLRFDSPKLLAPAIAEGACFAADATGKYYFVGSGGGGGGGYGIRLLPDVDMSEQYVLGLLNSALMSMYLKSRSTLFRGGYIALNKQYIERLPIRMIDFANRKDKARHDRMVDLVQVMLELHEKLPGARTPHDKTVIERQISATDRQIDQLVYELYGLTEEEIRIVEEASGS